MKTQTYVNASVKAFGLALLVTRLPEEEHLNKRHARYARQSKKFSGKVRKRLQELEGGSK